MPSSGSAVVWVETQVAEHKGRYAPLEPDPTRRLRPAARASRGGAVRALGGGDEAETAALVAALETVAALLAKRPAVIRR